MTKQTFAYPVRYMVLATWYGYKVVDTLSPEMERVKWFVDWYGNGMAVLRAHRYALYRNEAEGYVYYPKV